jgi:hypothetical protein
MVTAAYVFVLKLAFLAIVAQSIYKWTRRRLHRTLYLSAPRFRAPGSL